MIAAVTEAQKSARWRMWASMVLALLKKTGPPSRRVRMIWKSYASRERSGDIMWEMRTIFRM
jgi:hypothetical protein